MQWFNGYVYSLCVFRTQTSWVFASCIQHFDACRSEQIWTWPWICRYLQPEWLYLTCAYQGARWGSWRKCWEWQANHPWPPVKQKENQNLKQFQPFEHFTSAVTSHCILHQIPCRPSNHFCLAFNVSCWHVPKCSRASLRKHLRIFTLYMQSWSINKIW